MIIVQISDTHIDPGDPASAERLDDLDRVVRNINALVPAPEAVIHTGDIAHNGTAEKYQAALTVLKKLRAPLHVAAGNRDDRNLIRANFYSGRDLMPGTPFVQFELDFYPVRLIGLDTLSEVSNMGDFCSSRADSLRKALLRDSSKPTVLFMHHPPFKIKESKFQWQFDSKQAVDRIVSAIKGQKHVVAVLCGHAHRVSRGALAGVPSITVPSVAIDLRLGDLPEAAKAAPVFFIHHFDQDSGFRTELSMAD